jgi:hypothetical protein
MAPGKRRHHAGRLVLIIGLGCAGAGAWADEYSFERIFPSFDSAEAALNAASSDPEGRETNLRLGNFYFMQATSDSNPRAMRKECANKAIEVLEKSWRKDRKDNELCLSLGYAYTARAGITPLAELEALMGDINRAQNLFGMIAARLPRNIDARLARTMLNMNLNAQNGRPDALILEDYAVFMEGFQRLVPELRAHPYYLMGEAEMRLAKALVRRDQGKKAEARSLLGEIEPSLLPGAFRKLYDSLEKRLR